MATYPKARERAGNPLHYEQFTPLKSPIRRAESWIRRGPGHPGSPASKTPLVIAILEPLMRSSLVALFLLLGIVFPVEGQELRNLRINGFGGWSYGRTDQNRFLGYEPNGEFTKSPSP